MSEPREATEEFFQECIQVDQMHLTSQLMRHTGDFAFWSARATEARAYAAQTKADREFVWAKTYLLQSAKAKVLGEKVTVDIMKAGVEVDQDYRDAVQAEIDADAAYERLRGRVEAMREHRDMLQELGAMTRQEMKFDPVIRDTVTQSNRAT